MLDMLKLVLKLSFQATPTLQRFKNRLCPCDLCIMICAGQQWKQKRSVSHMHLVESRRSGRLLVLHWGHVMEVPAVGLNHTDDADNEEGDGTAQLHVPLGVALVVVLLPRPLGYRQEVHVGLLVHGNLFVRLPPRWDRASHGAH